MRVPRFHRRWAHRVSRLCCPSSPLRRLLVWRRASADDIVLDALALRPFLAAPTSPQPLISQIASLLLTVRLDAVSATRKLLMKIRRARGSCATGRGWSRLRRGVSRRVGCRRRWTVGPCPLLPPGFPTKASPAAHPFTTSVKHTERNADAQCRCRCTC